MASYDNLWQWKSEIDYWICQQICQQFIDDIWSQMMSYDEAKIPIFCKLCFISSIKIILKAYEGLCHHITAF